LASGLEDGTEHVTVTTTGTVTFVPDDPTQESFTGHLAERSGDNMNSKNLTITNAGNVLLHGSDGSLGKQHILSHLTVNANGTVTLRHRNRRVHMLNAGPGLRRTIRSASPGAASVCRSEPAPLAVTAAECSLKRSLAAECAAGSEA
jgi:alpha-D-ribose 1-methylphosphonate 5-triphosphate synthase subunit PhnL